MSSNPKTVFFYADAKNIRIGDPRLVKGRGHGIVRGVLTTNWTYHTEPGFVEHVDNIYRVCFCFSDDVVGKCLMPDGRLWLELPGWGTYLPRSGQDDCYWQTL